MMTMIMSSMAAANIRERLIVNNTREERRVRKLYISPLAIFNSAKEYNGMNYTSVYGVLMPR